MSTPEQRKVLRDIQRQRRRDETQEETAERKAKEHDYYVRHKAKLKTGIVPEKLCAAGCGTMHTRNSPYCSKACYKRHYEVLHPRSATGRANMPPKRDYKAAILCKVDPVTRTYRCTDPAMAEREG